MINGTLRFIHISDTHIGPTTDYQLERHLTYAHFQSLIHHINHRLGFTPAFVLHNGDVTYNPDAVAMQLATALIQEIHYPVYSVRGNHDDPEAMRQLIPQLPSGTGRIDYDFIIEDFHFIVLDSFGKIQPQGYLEQYQLEWLHSVCANSHAASLVIVVHHLPFPCHYTWYDTHMVIENHAEFLAVLRLFQPKIRGILFGHVHGAFSIFHEGFLAVSAPSVTYPLHPSPLATVHSADMHTQSGYNIVTLTHQGMVITHHHLPFDLSIIHPTMPKD